MALVRNRSSQNYSLIPILDHIEGENRRAYNNAIKVDQIVKQFFMFNLFKIS